MQNKSFTFNSGDSQLFLHALIVAVVGFAVAFLNQNYALYNFGSVNSYVPFIVGLIGAVVKMWVY